MRALDLLDKALLGCIATLLAMSLWAYLNRRCTRCGHLTEKAQSGWMSISGLLGLKPKHKCRNCGTTRPEKFPSDIGSLLFWAMLFAVWAGVRFIKGLN